MCVNRSLSALMSLALVISFVLSTMPVVGYAQIGSQAVGAGANSYEKALAAIETKVCDCLYVET